MRLLDIMTAPWAIVPGKLREIRAVYETHMRGPKIDLKELEKNSRSPFGPENPDDLRGYTVDRGVAVIPMTDVLTKSRTLFSFLFGGTSMRDIGDAFRNALADSDVHSIVLHIDSPGGTVDGTEELAAAIKAGRGTKPIVSVVDGMMASAAYWIGSAADRIYVSGETNEVGSIGVVATHMDISKWEETIGVKYTDITAGKYKRIASMHKPLSDEGAAYIQDQVDTIYGIFVETVADFRGCSVEQILEAADGKVFMGKAAIENGLVDGMATLNEVINQLEEDNQMDLQELKTKHADVYRAAFEEGRASGSQEAQETVRVAAFTAGKSEGQTEGKAAERKRIGDMEAMFIPGHESLLAACRQDETCSPADFAMKQATAEKAIREKETGNLTADAIAPLRHAAPPAPGEDAAAAAAEQNLPIEQKAKAEWDRTPEIRQEFGDNYGAYEAYRKNVESGRVKILGRKDG
jgi:signal peptide peptidase SppA